MHQLLLITLLFLPGIKSTFEVKTEIYDYSRDADKSPVYKQDISPLEEPNTADSINSIPDYPKDDKHYDNHYYRKYEDYSRKNHYDKPKNEERKHFDHRKDYDHVKRYENKHNHHEDRGMYHEGDHHHKSEYDYKPSSDYDKYKMMKKYEEYKNKKGNYGKYEKDRKYYKKEDWDRYGSKGDGKFKKYEKDRKGHYNYDMKREQNERYKRHADSDSDEDDYDDDDVEENVDTSIGSVERSVLSSYFDHRDDSRPYEDAVEVKLQEKDQEHQGMLPVEEKVSKKMAYVSCSRDGTGCGRETVERGEEQGVNAERAGARHNEEASQEEHIDMAAWLKAFEEQIIKTGVGLRYNHE